MMSFDEELTSWVQAVFNELEGKNLRSVVILCVSILDVQLENLIKAVLIDDKNRDDSLFEGNMPLSTFSAKISMAFYLGLITEHEKNTLSTIRKIRNKLAHEIIIESSEVQQSINGLISYLSIPQGMYLPIELFCGIPSQIDKSYNPANEKDPMKRFVNAFYYLTEYLSFHKLEHPRLEKRNALLPYIYIEIVRDVLVEDNRRIVDRLKKCIEKATKDIEMLTKYAGKAKKQYRGIKLDTFDSYQDAITIVNDELRGFREELQMRESGNYSLHPDSNYANTCQTIQAMNVMIDQMKEYCK